MGGKECLNIESCCDNTVTTDFIMLFRKQLLVIIKKGIIKSTIKMRIDLIVHNEFVAV